MTPKNEEGIMPSILDRLLDPESGGTAWRRGYGADQMFRAVTRDLEDLLNTRQSHAGLPPEYENLHTSIFAFGLPDLTSLEAASIDQRKAIARVIEKLITLYEPRLRDIHVHLATLGEQDPLDRKVRFHVEARLRLAPSPEIAFDTILELSTGQYAIQASGG